MIDIEKIRELARKATPGVHAAYDARNLEAPAACVNFAVVAGVRETARVWLEDDARFYAALNPATVLAMCEMIDKQRAEISVLEEDLQRVRADNGQFGVGA